MAVIDPCQDRPEIENLMPHPLHLPALPRDPNLTAVFRTCAPDLASVSHHQ